MKITLIAMFVQYDIDSFKESKTDSFEYNFHEARLSASSVALATGNNAICVFVNDVVDAETLQKMQDENINILALRVSALLYLPVRSAC